MSRAITSGSHGFRKSSFSAQGGCVEIAFAATGEVLVRDSKMADGGPVLTFNEKEWRAFTTAVHHNEFEYPAAGEDA